VTYIETNLKERKVLTINKGSSCTHDFNNTKLFKHIDQVVELLNTYYTTNRHQLNPTFANVQLLREIEKKQQALTLQTKQAQDAAEESKRALQELADKQQEIIRINAEAQESADITAQINQDTLIKIERDSAVLSEKLAAYNALSSTDAIVDKMKTLVAGTNLVFSDLGNTITECAQHIPALTSINEDLAQKLSEKIAAFNTMRREIVETQRLLYKQSSAAFNMHQIDICPVVVACPINSEIMPPGSIYETGSNSIKRRVK
jgi:chromosome segregation ATPase